MPGTSKEVKTMRTIVLIVLVCCALFMAGCEAEDGTTTLPEDQFIGGTEGLIIAFEENSPPAEVYDGGATEFDVVIKLENKGESLVEKDNVHVKLSGIHPSDFGKSETDFVLNAPDDLVEVQRDPSGRVLDGMPTFVEFTGLSHDERIAGAALSFPLRADVCYLYTTLAGLKLCVRENLQQPIPGGLCDVAGQRTFANSGAPLQISNVAQQARARNKVGFTFDITHAGVGTFYEKGSDCDQTDRKKSKRVFVRVESGIPGLTCTGLVPGGDGAAEGSVQLFDEKRTISCTQEFSSLGDYELPVSIELTYDYLQSIQTSVLVRSSGE